MKNKGLGTGLGALFGSAAIENPPNDFEYIAIQKIEPRPDQPRSLFEHERIEELAESIREHGVLQPLTVRPTGDGYYQIVAGERRWRAAREAGLADVPVRIIDADDNKATKLALVENLQREDLTPIEEARGYKALMDDAGMTQEEVAAVVSKSRPAVANALRLLALPPEAIDLVENGSLPAGGARALLALKDKDKLLPAAHTIIENGLSVRDAEALVNKLNKEKGASKVTDGSRNIYFEDAKNTLQKALGRRVSIKPGKEKGKIEIEYYDVDDFNNLFDELSSLESARNRRETNA